MIDTKLRKRIKDKDAFRAFHETGSNCICCGYYRVHAHHLISRGQGGDDALENLVPLCVGCHSVLHDGHPRRGDFGQYVTPTIVRDRIGAFLLREDGSDHLYYVLNKLGREAGWAWLEKQFGVVEP